MEDENNLNSPKLISGFSKPPEKNKSKFSDLANTYSNNQYYNTGFGESSYDKNFNFDAQFDEKDPSGSLNENRYEQQGWATQIGAGIVRAATKAVVEVAKLPGVVGGLIAAPFVEDGQGYDTVFNNGWIKTLDNINEKINTDVLPVYVGKAIKEGNLWDNITSTSFWATDGADGLGYMLAMMAPGAGIAKLGLGAKLISNGSRAAKYLGMADKVENAANTLSKIGITGKTLDIGLGASFNTMFEAGAEAKGVGDEIEANAKQSLEIGIITQEEYNDIIVNQRPLAMANTFKSNLAILIGPNLLMSKAIYGKAADKLLTETATDGIKQRVGAAVKRLGKAFASEGFVEEASQTTAQNTFTNKAMRQELGKGNDFNIGELTNNYLNTLASVEGQKAIFLGGMLGGPFMSYQGRQEDNNNRKVTNEILSNVNGAINNFNTIFENDVYTKGEDGKSIYKRNTKGQFTSQKILDPIKVIEVASALNFTEDESIELDQAIQNGNTEIVNNIKQRAIFDMIIPAVYNDNAGLEALEQKLNESNEFQEIIERDSKSKNGKTNKDFIKETLEAAKHLQEQNKKFQDFGQDVIQLNDERATSGDKTDYLNRLNSQYLSTKYKQYNSEKKLIELEKRRNNLYNELDLDKNYDATSDTPLVNMKSGLISNNNIEERANKVIDAINNNPLLFQIEEIIKNIKYSISKNKKDINELWSGKDTIDKSFKNFINNRSKLREQTTPEIEQKVQEAVTQINTSITEEQIDNIPITNTIADPIINQAKEIKKEEIIQKQIQNESFEIENAIENEKLNPPVNVSYIEITSTEGSEISDELTPTNNSNISSEELNDVETGNIDNGKGVKVISTNRETGKVLPFITQFYPKYVDFERTPVIKKGNEVSFEINTKPGNNPNLNKALKAYYDGDFSNTKLLFDYLPINVKFTDEVNAPIETRRTTGDINPETEILRIEIINALMNGVSIENIKGTVQDQYKGQLKVTDDYSENNILDLDGVKDLKYIRENLYFINGQGQLQNILTEDTVNFQNLFTKESDRTKNNARGEIYLMIPQANGKPFPLKLNIKKLEIEEAELIYELYRQILLNNKTIDTTINELDINFQEIIKATFTPELKVIGGVIDDIKLQELIDLLIYSNSTSPKSQMRIVDGVLSYGSQKVTADNINDAEESIVKYLVENKRHQIKIGPKSETDNTKTNLKSNSANYLKYLIDNKILSTNAVVNEPTFQGYTNIYLNPTVSINNANNLKVVKSQDIPFIEDKISKILTIDELTEAFNTLTAEQKIQYKDLFTDKKNKLNSTPNNNVGELGIKLETQNTGLEDMFNDTIPAVSGAEFVSNSNILTYTPTGKSQQTYTIDKTRILNSKGEEVFKEESADRRKIFANLAVKEGRAKVIEDNSGVKYVVNNKQQIMSTVTGKIMGWAENHSTRILLNNKYNSISSPKISDSGVQINSENTGFEDLFENKLNITRNSQENFVSLSEIPGTQENNTMVKTQNEVYKVPTNPKERMMDLKKLQILIKKKVAGEVLQANEQVDFNKFKNAYPQEYEKNCK